MLYFLKVEKIYLLSAKAANGVSRMLAHPIGAWLLPSALVASRQLCPVLLWSSQTYFKRLRLYLPKEAVSHKLFSRQLFDTAEAPLWVWLPLLPARSPSTNSARICWAPATVTQQGFAEPNSLYNMYIKGELSIWVTESSPQAKQGFAEPPRITMYSTRTQRMMAESDSWTHSSGTQQKKMGESGSSHTQLSFPAKKTAESGSPHKRLRDSVKKMAESGSPHTRLRDSAKKMAESGSSHTWLRDSAKEMAESGSPHTRLRVLLSTQDATRTPDSV